MPNIRLLDAEIRSLSENVAKNNVYLKQLKRTRSKLSRKERQLIDKEIGVIKLALLLDGNRLHKLRKEKKNAAS